MKKLKRFSICIVAALCALFVFCIDFNFTDITKTSVDAAVGSNYVDVGNILLDNYEDCEKQFNGNILAELYKQMSGNSNATFSNIESMASSSSETNSDTFRNNNKTFNGGSGKDICLTFGGLKWTVTYLFKDVNGNVCVDLLLQDATGLSAFNNFSASGYSVTYHPNMYATSYVRAVTLNNGGLYSVSTTSSSTATKNKNNTFAKFTMGKSEVPGSLTDYIVTPRDVLYQTSIQKPPVKDSIAYAWDQVFNQVWSNPTDVTYETKTQTYYNKSSYKSNWADDYLWIPSDAELGRFKFGSTSSQYIGRWALSSNQFTTSKSYWSRTAWTENYYSSTRVMATGGVISDSAVSSSYKYAVRPGLHLNLSKAEESSVKPVEMPEDKTYTYDGEQKSFDKLEKFDANLMTLSSSGTLTPVNAGEYVATINLKDGYCVAGQTNTSLKTKDVKIIINPKTVDKPTDATFVYDGTKRSFENLSWYNSDLMNLSYDETQSFTDVGTYTATVSLVSNNYQFKGTTEKEISVNLVITSRIISPPTLVNFEYNGEDRTSYLTSQNWYDAEYMTLQNSDGSLTDAKEYTVVVKLTNDNIAFAGKDTSAREFEISFVIDKKVISVQTLPITEQGVLREGEQISPTIALYERDTIDNGKAPQFGIEYKKLNGDAWMRELPTNAGGYYARAYIINTDTCNYVLSGDGQTTFTKPKQLVSVPYLVFGTQSSSKIEISGSTTTVLYSGAFQTFKLVNFGSSLDDYELINVEVGNMAGGIQPVGSGIFNARYVGIYTIEVSLTDSLNMDWADYKSNSSSTRIVTLVITKAELNVEIDEFDQLKESFEKGTVDSITLKINGVVNNENVKLNIYYTENGGIPIYIANDNFSTVGSVITVTIELENFKVNTKYALFVELANDEEADANRNYKLINMNEPLEFFILQATINEIIAQWQYSNIIAGMGTLGVDTIIEYNGQEYLVLLDSSKLPTGVKATYTNQSGTNAGSYTTQVVLSCESGYEFASGLQTVYSIDWVISPLKYDLSTLVWENNFIYDGLAHTMSVINLPDWIQTRTITSDIYTNITNIVGKYIACYELFPDDNHVFINSKDGQEGYDWIKISNNGAKATITNNWEIEKITINVSDAPRQWVEKEYFDSENGEYYKVLVPLAWAEFETQLLLEYFENYDSSTGLFSNPIDPSQIKVNQGIKTYYVKVSINPDSSSTHQVKNVLNGEEWAYISFDIGDNRLPITVTHNYVDNSTVYNGLEQPLVPKYGSLQFKVSYYIQDSHGDFSILLDDGVIPTNAGMYFVVIEIVGELADVYKITNKSFIITIQKIVLTTNGWTYDGGLEPPTCNVVGDLPNEDVYKYVIVDKDGNVVDGELKYNTNYTIKLVLNDEVNYEFGSGARTEFDFRPFGADENLVTVENPIISNNVLVYNGFEQTFVIDNWDAIKDYVEISGSLSAVNVNKYYVTLTFKDGIIATWQDGSFDVITLEFEIVPLEITIPTVSQIRYTGSEINVLDYFIPFGNWKEWVEITEDSDSQIQILVNKYVLKFKIKEEYIGNIIINNQSASTFNDETTNDETTLEENIIVVEWEILKAQISGEWKSENGVMTFVPNNPEDVNLYDIKYYDENGNEVAFENLIEGNTYTAKLVLKDGSNYEFDSSSADFSLDKQFEYNKPATALENILEFIKTNWLWFVIGLVVLIILIIIIIIIIVKRKKEEEVNDKEAENNSESAPEQNNNDVNNQSNQSAMSDSSGFVKQGQPYQDMQGYHGYVNNQPMGQNFGYLSDYDRRQDNEIQELREEVKRLSKYKVASDEEKEQSKRLEKIENILMQFLLRSFSNNPNWVPFDNQDMIDYSIDDLMKVYAKAKQVEENRIIKRNDNNEKVLNEIESAESEKIKKERERLKLESEELERKVAEYNRMKEDTQYENLLKEIRQLKEENKILKDNFESEKRERIEDELKKTKSELEKKMTEVEGLKEKNSKYEQEKLIDEIVNKNRVQAPAKMAVDKLEFSDAFYKLPADQKRYYSLLEQFALSMPQAKPKQAKYHLTIGFGNSPYVKFVIKYNTLIACFGSTEIKIENDSSVEAAKQLIYKTAEKVLNARR